MTIQSAHHRLCAHCRGQGIEHFRPVPDGDGVQCRILCEDCACGTPWCVTAERAWEHWDRREQEPRSRIVVGRIILLEGTRVLDNRPYSDADGFRQAESRYLGEGWKSLGGVGSRHYRVSVLFKEGSL